jgi:Zn-dependent peptidase ImmA (M78 family)
VIGLAAVRAIDVPAVGADAGSRARAGLVRRTVAAARAKHPELRSTPSLADVESVLEREDILVVTGKLSPGYYGSSMCFLRRPGMLIAESLDDEARRWVLLHEWAHLLIHHPDRALMERRAAEIRAVGENSSPLCQRVEREANLFADLVLDGPFSPDSEQFDKQSKSIRQPAPGYV